MSLASFIERQNFVNRVLNLPDDNVPTTFDECKPHFKTLVSQLSPENLHCDGEATQTQVNERLRNIAEIWDELETISGRDVEQDEVWNF